jgi:HSP20 family protein
MSLMRWNPNSDLGEFDRLMNRMVERMRTLTDMPLLPFDSELLQRADANLPAIDMTSDDKHVIVRAEMPGFKEDEVKVDVRGNVLTITAESKQEREDKQENWHIREMRYGKFARSVMLPEEVTFDKADATLEDGILTVKLPKQKPSPVHQIAVKARNLLKGGNKS